MDRWLAACALAGFVAAAGAGCIEFVDGDQAGTGSVGPDDDLESAAFAASSPEERKVHVVLVRGGDRHPYALDDGSVALSVDGVACTGLRAAGDATWQVGDAVIVTPVTGGCGGRMASGSQVTVTVRLFGDLAFEGVVTVR